MVLAYSVTEICIFAFSTSAADTRLQAENTANEQYRTRVNYDARNDNLNMLLSLPQNPPNDNDGAINMQNRKLDSIPYCSQNF